MSSGKKRLPPRAKGRRRTRPGRWRTATTSDILDLYEQSVQDPASECEFIEQVWKDYHRRRSSRRACRAIREDFCGTAAVAIDWVRRGKSHTAIGVDLDASVLGRAEANAQSRLRGRRRRRLRLVRADVRRTRVPRVDAILALNFSYFVFKTRTELGSYFRGIHRGLRPGGLVILDAYGGSDSFAEAEEEQDFDGFTYVWDQHVYNPVTNEVLNHIHFRFPDGTELREAFTYDWRLWTLPEIQEALRESGFRNVAVYWEGTDRTGEGNGEFTPSTRGEACAAWVAYIVGQR